jgi:long-chain acyl-CoA synthetase
MFFTMLLQLSDLVGARHDAAVQVGGVNVFPSLVADVSRRHPMIEDVSVRLMRPDEGNRLKAYVVARPDVTDTNAFISELRAWIDREVPTHERPKALRVGGGLPVSATGKPSDWNMDDSESLTTRAD